MSQNYQNITTGAHGRTYVVTINRPEVRNAVDSKTAVELAAAFIAFDQSDDFDLAVLTGAGGHFCAGADLKAVSEGDFTPPVVPEVPIAEHDPRGPMGPSYLRLSKPVIAAVSGHAVAGGLELALWCDLRVADETAVFGVYCRRWGVPLIDGGTVRLPRLIGHSRAMDLILTGRSVTAEEGLEMGLANRLVPAGQSLEAALQLASDISRFPQLCLRNDRQSAIEQWGRDFDTAMANEATLGRSTLQSGETVTGATRFASGRGRSGDFSDI